MRRIRIRIRTLVAVAGATIGVLAAFPAPSSAIALEETCILPLTRFDSGTLNILYPDEAAQYWTAGYLGLPGTRVRIEGQYPHSRYMSFNAYDPLLRPVDALSDVQIQPDSGSTNPFAGGANRNAAQRDYTVYIEGGAKPASPASNTIYTGDLNLAGAFIYRIYIPDAGQDEFGGVGLPRAFLEIPGLGDLEISLLDCSRLSKPSGQQLNDIFSSLGSSSQLDIVSPGGYPNPEFTKFVNLGVAAVGVIFGSPGTEEIRDALQGPLVDLAGSGGFASNIDNAYVSAVINRSFGQVAVVRARAPTFADTRGGAATMPAGVDLRYFSMCQNEAATQRFIACRSDDQTAVDQNGYFNYVISTAPERPSNARLECGFTWMPWGPVARGLLIYRHMLPDPGFTESIQNATFRNERATMGEYLPTVSYAKTRADFERLGCPTTATGSGAAAGTVTRSSATGKRANALRLCKKKKRAKKRKRCRRKARKLPA